MSEETSFSDMLKKYVHSISHMEEIARITETDTLTVFSWLEGKSLPTKSQLELLLSVLPTSTLRRRLLRENFIDERMRYQASQSDVVALTSVVDSINSLQSQITELNKSIDIVTAQMPKSDVATSADNIGLLNTEGLNTIRKQLTELARTGAELTAQVEMPSAEHMKVKLVPATFIARMEEYGSDNAVWYTIAGALDGAIIGIGVNAATGGTMTPTAWALIFIFVALTVVFVILIQRNQERIETAKWQILGIGIDPLLQKELRIGGMKRLIAQWTVGRWYKSSSESPTEPNNPDSAQSQNESTQPS